MSPIITAIKGTHRTRYYIYRDGAFLGSVSSSLDPAIENIEKKYHLAVGSVKEAVKKEQAAISRSRF